MCLIFRRFFGLNSHKIAQVLSGTGPVFALLTDMQKKILGWIGFLGIFTASLSAYGDEGGPLGRMLDELAKRIPASPAQVERNRMAREFFRLSTQKSLTKIESARLASLEFQLWERSLTDEQRRAMARVLLEKDAMAQVIADRIPVPVKNQSEFFAKPLPAAAIDHTRVAPVVIPDSQLVSAVR